MTETKKRIPALRFPGFEGEWQEKRLCELCSTFKSGIGITSSKITDTGLYPVYGGNGLRGYTNNFTHDGFYILIGRQGALCGNINRSYGKTYISEHAIACQANVDSDTEWLAQRLDYMNLNRLSESSAQPGLSVEKLLRLKVSAPIISEQQKIASFLSAADNRLGLLKKKKERLEAYKRGAMQQIFSRRLRFKDPKGNNYPEWVEVKLGKHISQRSVRNKNGTITTVLSVNNKKGFVRQLDQFDGYSVASDDTANYKIVQRNDFAYNPSRINVGSIACLKDEEVGIVSPMYVVFRLDKKLDNIYLENLFQTHKIKHFIKIGCSGSVRDSLNFDVLADFDTSLPILAEQQKIADFLSAIDKKIELCDRQIADTEKFKKGLLQQMFV